MCHSVYEKDHGCNHMTCTNCQPPTHFCYICGNILNDQNPLSHFSDKESKCYNRLWDNDKKNDVNDDEDNKINESDNIIEEDSKIKEQNEKNIPKKTDFTEIMIDKINYSNSFNEFSNNNKIYYKGKNKQNFKKYFK